MKLSRLETRFQLHWPYRYVTKWLRFDVFLIPGEFLTENVSEDINENNDDYVDHSKVEIDKGDCNYT